MTVMAGAEIDLKFHSPLTDNATPERSWCTADLRHPFTTGSSRRQRRRHGGFSFGDTNVGLIVSNPDLHSRVVKDSSGHRPRPHHRILEALGIDPSELQSGTPGRHPSFCRSSSSLEGGNSGS